VGDSVNACLVTELGPIVSERQVDGTGETETALSCISQPTTDTNRFSRKCIRVTELMKTSKHAQLEAIHAAQTSAKTDRGHNTPINDHHRPGEWHHLTTHLT